MSVSIVIPAINEAESLRTLLPSLVADVNVAEVIVVDGGSRDDSCEVASSAGATLFHSEPGRARQMNTGASGATGDILLFLHADTLLPDNAIALVVEAMTGKKGWGRFDVRLSGSRWLLRLVARMINLRSCLSAIATGDQAIFLRRELFEQLGGYAEIPLMEDVELSKRLRRYSRPICLRQPLTTSSRRWEHYGILRTILLMWWIRLAYFLGASPQSLARQYRRSDTEGRGS